MGNGLMPGPVDEGHPIVIDEGTLARTGSPPPGPIGLDAKGGTAKAKPSMAEQIVSYPRNRRGQRVGDGQCFALTDRALRAAGARSAADYGTITPSADYVWGTSVTLSELRPGDVIQFRGYRSVRVVVTESSSKTTTEETEQTRPHHTAIVERVGEDGAVTALEQNSPEGSAVVRTLLHFSNSTQTSGNRRTTTTVEGTFWFYRPQAALP
jgi:hypothetical protein